METKPLQVGDVVCLKGSPDAAFTIVRFSVASHWDTRAFLCVAVLDGQLIEFEAPEAALVRLEEFAVAQADNAEINELRTTLAQYTDTMRGAMQARDRITAELATLKRDMVGALDAVRKEFPDLDVYTGAAAIRWLLERTATLKREANEQIRALQARLG